MSHDQTPDIEHLLNHYDSKEQRFKTAHEVAFDKEVEQERKMQAAWERGYHPVPENLINDWTGQKWVDTADCWGAEPCPMPKGDGKQRFPVPESARVQLQDSALMQTEADPFDPNWADTEAII